MLTMIEGAGRGVVDAQPGRGDGVCVLLCSRRLEGRRACMDAALNKGQHVSCVKVMPESGDNIGTSLVQHGILWHFSLRYILYQAVYALRASR